MIRPLAKTPSTTADEANWAAANEKMSRHHRLMLWLASHAGELEIEGSWIARYSTTLIALGVATVVRWLVDPLLGDRSPYGMYLIAVLFVVWRAGLGPALATVFGGALLGRFFFDPPRWTLWFVTESNETALFMSLTVGVLSALVCESLRVTARDNRRLYDLARQADARKDEFLATLAHELRNPLMPIRNATYVLETIDGQNPRVSEMTLLIGRHTEHLIRLVNDLLDLSRITRRKIDLRPERVDLQTIVADAMEAVRPLVDEKRQHLSVDLPAKKIDLNADGVRLTQVVTNLLHNAAKYTDKEGRIWLSAELASDEVVLRVRDTGIGIPPEMCEQIFDLFQQVHQGIEHSAGGLGIGLTLVRALVHLHGGTVIAHSPGPGLGSEFVVRLPAVQASSEVMRSKEATIDADPTPSEGPLRILIVDDSPAVASTLEMILVDWKHVVEVSSDGFAALEMARTFKPDVILADLGMPRMNGYQLAEELRRLPSMHGVALIAVSGYGQPADHERSMAAGFSRHLVKPVDLVELKQILADHRSRRVPDETATQSPTQ